MSRATRTVGEVNLAHFFPVSEYVGRYSISRDGQIWSHVSNRLLSPSLGNIGYMIVNLYKGPPGRTPKRHLLHRLLATTFIDNPDCLPFVLHENDNPLDNRIENLSWGTPSENHHDRVKNGIHWQANKTHCKQGHPFSGENLKVLMEGRGVHRKCRQCMRESSRRREARKRKERLERVEG